MAQAIKQNWNRRTALGVIKRLTGSGRVNAASTTFDNSSTTTQVTDGALQTSASNLSADYSARVDATPYADNDDIDKVRFWKRGLKKWQRVWRRIDRAIDTFMAYVAELRKPHYTPDERWRMVFRLRRWQPDELDNYRKAKKDREVFINHKAQSKILGQSLVNRLTELRFCYFITKNERVFVKRKITISHVDVSPFAYTFHIYRVPFGVKMTDIAQDWVTNELSVTAGKKVRIELDMNGLRITVEVGSTLSIPNFVGFGDIDDKYTMPKNLPPLAFWAGLTNNGAPVYRNLADAPHLIIAGSSGGGKSNMENTIACTLIRNNTPDRLRAVFFDLKGGVEFSQYEKIPHLLPMKIEHWSCDGIVQYPSDVIPALKFLFEECMSRLEKLKHAGVKNIGEYNRKRRANRLPYILIMFDEWASTVKLVGKESETILSNIANLSRAAGMHFILSTQYPKAEILNTTISVNFPWRIAFNMPAGASQSVLGDWGAVGLSPVGRAVLLTMDGQTQIQTPRITNANVEQIVLEAQLGERTGKDLQNVDANDILEWALNKASGKLDQESVFNQFKEKIKREELRRLLKDMEDNIFEVSGALYKVLPGSGTLARRMILAEEGGVFPENPAYSEQPTTKNNENGEKNND